MSRTVAVLRDPELVELLAGRPELLAIADAIAGTAPRRRAGKRSRLAITAAALVAVAAAALAAPWSTSRGGVIQKALAAVTTDSVLHVVLVSEVPGTATVDLRTGKARPETLRVEQWFDARRGLKSYTTNRSGLTDAFLETPAGVWSTGGRVPTCAWIAAHPREATRLRVSCSASGVNGTSPRRSTEPRPSSDPALAAFVGGYRAALRSGRARNLGVGRVGRAPVYWIGFDDRGRRERVAVDKRTYRPLLVETVIGGKLASKARVTAIGTVPFSRSLFARPRRAALRPTAGEVAKTRHVTLRSAQRALGGATRALGQRFASLPLVDARIDEVTSGYGPLSGRRPTRGAGVQLMYGESGFTSRTPFLRISESLRPQVAYGMQPARAIRNGTLLLTRIGNAPGSGWSVWFGEVRAGRLFVSLQASSRDLVVRAAMSLARAR